MPDILDKAKELSDLHTDSAVAAAKAEAAQFEIGGSGDCDGCGEYFERVVARQGGNYCGGCRDELKLG